MRFTKIVQLFENFSLQTKEEIILGTIINCKNTLNTLGLSINTDNNEGLIKLFESVSGINIPNNQISNFSNENVILIEDYHNNPYAYLKDVKKLTESYIPLNSDLMDIDEIKSFSISIQSTIKDLEKINDLQKIENYNENILKTKIFSKSPIFIYGVNLFEIEKLKNTLNLTSLYSVIYNKSDKQLLFVGDSNIFAYDIKTDQFAEQHLINTEIEKLTINKDNYLQIIKKEISNNIVIIFQTIDSDKKFTDNLYLDNARLLEIAKQKEFKQKNSSVIK